MTHTGQATAIGTILAVLVLSSFSFGATTGGDSLPYAPRAEGWVIDGMGPFGPADSRTLAADEIEIRLTLDDNVPAGCDSTFESAILPIDGGKTPVAPGASLLLSLGTGLIGWMRQRCLA